ncbi:MAG TPA: NAD-dependent epimerase/dehydratase family protein, partial [Candidatus Fermentibacter daniensis]|nr:NAD-dependent epimerase/dehydratase family protein [Candidatus Fermentibacter daniensis]
IGGAGFIGTHLVSELLATGRTVTILDRRTDAIQELPRGADYVAGDFGQCQLIRELLCNHEEVIHLAYTSVPKTSFENPFSDLLENLPPTVQLFAETAESGRKLLFVSSGGTVYGEAGTLPIREDHPTRPISPYGLTKLTLEGYAHLYAVTHGLKFVCVRPANAFGPGQKPFTGQGFIASAMTSMMRGLPVTVFGQRGTVRDYIYVGDLAAGIVSALEKGRPSEIYNLGSGVGRTNMDVIEAITPLLEGLAYKIRIEHLPERTFDVRANILDSGKLHKDTGWSPTTPFDKGLLRTREWLKDFHG